MAQPCYGLESTAGSAGIGLTFGAALAIFASVAIQSAVILAITASGTIEVLRRANWSREA